MITTDDIEMFTPEIVVLIIAPTGSGKSHFIKHVLNEYFMKNEKDCLYLLPRSPIIDQFRQEINSPQITYDSYQKIEYHKSRQTSNPPEYLSRNNSYIVCDEAHYFFEDARFNHNNDISLDWILQQKQSVKIFMTATGDTLKKYLIAKGCMIQELYLPNDFEHIENLYFFKDDKQLELIAEDVINSGKKGLFVIFSAKKAYALWEKYKNQGMFMCSKSNKDFSEHMKNELVSELLKNEMFDCSILITTAVLDCGVNLKDKELTTVCLDLMECTSIIQALGRKRAMSNDEKIDVFIKTVDNRRLGGEISKYERKLKQAKLLRDNPKAYEIKYGRIPPINSMIVDESFTDAQSSTLNNKKRVRENEMFQAEAYVEIYKRMIQMGSGGFCKYIAQVLGKFDAERGYYDYKMFDEKKEVQNLYQFLDSIVDTPLYTPADRAELIERLGVYQNGRLCRGYDTLSGWLKDSKMPFRLERFRKERVIDGKRHNHKGVWVIVKHNDTIKGDS